MKSDKIIWNDFRKGENYALSHIYYQHIQILFRYGKKFSNDDGLIKDTIQDLFFDLIRTRRKLGETDNIKFYLFKSFRRKLVSNIKKTKLTFVLTDEKLPEAKIEYSVEQKLIEKEELTQKEEIMRKALTKLSHRQREILFYRFTCDFEYNQICEIMQMNYDSARKQVFRALKALKEVLAGKDIFLLLPDDFPKKFTILKN
jgi:RNA polymerase sigma factor (sigma-70 family)